MGPFFFLIGFIAIAWFIRCVYVTHSWTKLHTYVFARKKCRTSNAVSLEDPYSVTRGGNQCKELGLTSESKSGLFGRSAQITDHGRSPLESHDGRLDSSADLIGV